MTTDINWLHEVIEGKRTGVACGISIAKCHEVAGVIELGTEARIYCVTENLSMSYCEMQSFMKVMVEHDISTSWVTDHSVLCNGWCKVQFCSREQWIDTYERGASGYMVEF